jgi:predicted regulator of Ras-like GTPase activity (Roadblock/LC7/MglB family)
VSGPALTPDLALDYLGELSTDIRAALVLDSSGGVAAVTGDDRQRGERMGALATELLDAASEASAGGDQVEVVTIEGSVFAVRGESWTVAVVAGRQPLASLMFYDLRNVVRELG